MKRVIRHVQDVLGTRGHGLVNAGLRDLDRTIQKLDIGAQEIVEDHARLDAKLEVNRKKHFDKQRQLYEQQEQIKAAAERARRVAGRFRELGS